jgi:hypothetical protein
MELRTRSRGRPRKQLGDTELAVLTRRVSGRIRRSVRQTHQALLIAVAIREAEDLARLARQSLGALPDEADPVKSWIRPTTLDTIDRQLLTGLRIKNDKIKSYLRSKEHDRNI